MIDRPTTLPDTAGLEIAQSAVIADLVKECHTCFMHDELLDNPIDMAAVKDYAQRIMAEVKGHPVYAHMHHLDVVGCVMDMMVQATALPCGLFDALVDYLVEQ